MLPIHFAPGDATYDYDPVPELDQPYSACTGFNPDPGDHYLKDSQEESSFWLLRYTLGPDGLTVASAAHYLDDDIAVTEAEFEACMTHYEDLPQRLAAVCVSHYQAMEESGFLNHGLNLERVLVGADETRVRARIAPFYDCINIETETALFSVGVERGHPVLEISRDGTTTKITLEP